MRRGLAVAVIGVLVAVAATAAIAAAGGIDGALPGSTSLTSPTTAPAPSPGTDPPPATDRPAPLPTPVPTVPMPVPTTPTVPTEPTVPVEPVEPAVLRPGDRGAPVQALQERLVALGYWVGGGADGVYGQTTAQAVMAFQKVQGLQRDGLAGPATLDALATAGRPDARSGPGSGRVVEIDLTRQVLLVVDDGRVVEAFNTSTGSRATPTPPGRFTVQRQIDGVRRAPLGDLYRPKYFNGGIAVHGSPSIPGHPASHGCARLHDRAMDHLWSTGALDLGGAVWVYRA